MKLLLEQLRLMLELLSTGQVLVEGGLNPTGMGEHHPLLDVGRTVLLLLLCWLMVGLQLRL